MNTFNIAADWWQLVVMALVSYLVGCVNFAKIISLSKKRDITTIGSGNPGTMNMSREFGLKIGILTFLLDVLKGGIPGLVTFFIYRGVTFAGTQIWVSDLTRYLCGLFVIVGHIFPVTMGFKGGKGIASTFGMFWIGLSCESPWFILIGLGISVCMLLFIAWTEWGSLGSLTGVSIFTIVQVVILILRYQSIFSLYLVALYVIIFLVSVLTWTAHKENLLRLFAGEEHRTSIKKLAKKK